MKHAFKCLIFITRSSDFDINVHRFQNLFIILSNRRTFLILENIFQMCWNLYIYVAWSLLKIVFVGLMVLYKYTQKCSDALQSML